MFRYPETKQNKVKNKDNILKKTFIFVLWNNFMQLQSYPTCSKTAPFPYCFNIQVIKKSPIIPNSGKKTQNNQQNTQKPTTLYA